ncbi:catenin delta-2 isoform X2 [Lucilia sericata]|uniref:catenin delta-2 isoform X2 n=1 Tax=Lucilia sericata TaxID=13632 RepID=UPI0018A87316|nr:catenin delta-2 isoform X2 [Lucilia sericata]
MEPSVCIPDEADFDGQNAPMQEYGQYTTVYPNAPLYATKGPAGMSVGRMGSQCSYRTDHASAKILGSQSNLTSSVQELNAAVGVPTDQGAMMASNLRYMQPSQYEEMSEYGINPVIPFPSESQYGEDTPVAYGYVSEANYVMPSVSAKQNAYVSRPPMFDDNRNGAEVASAMGLAQQGFEDAHDFQNKMSQLTISSFGVVSQHMRNGGKDEIVDGSCSDICSTMRWRDPNLSEVISFLNNPNNAIKANAAAYLQHLCYMDDPIKQRTRILGGIPPLIRLLSYEAPEIYKNACGALRNLSYGRQNDENKREIKNAGGLAALVNLLCRTQESEVRELVTGVLWNMSSCEDIKRFIIDECLAAVVSNIIHPHSGWDPVCPGETCFSTVFRNASGVLRNVSSAGEYARTQLRNCDHLVECLLYVVRQAIEKNNISNKTVENCVCILRNLSYRCQEVEDPNYDKQPISVPTRALSSTKGENLGCFGTSKKKKAQAQLEQQNESVGAQSGSTKNTSDSANRGPLKGYEHLWQPEVVQYYLALLQSCSNPETLEAAAGAIQNLSACYWQPSIDIRAAVRKEKGLPILVELLRMEVDRVVCAVATALRNLAIDQRNKELIGKYAMRDLVQKLPSGNPQHDQNTSDDTITAVLATINEVIKKNAEFSRSLLDAGGVERLMNITNHRQKYTSCVNKFASQVLFTMWQHHELRDVYKKHGWKEQDFLTKFIDSHSASAHSPNNSNSTLNRPMASQGRTRYEDRTIQRGTNSSGRNKDQDQQTQQQQQQQQQQRPCQDPQMLRQMVDEFSMNGVADDTYQRPSAYTSAVPLYIPNSDSTRNPPN